VAAVVIARRDRARFLIAPAQRERRCKRIARGWEMKGMVELGRGVDPDRVSYSVHFANGLALVASADIYELTPGAMHRAVQDALRKRGVPEKVVQAWRAKVSQ